MFDSPQPQTAQLNNYILLISRQILLAVGIIVVVSVIPDYYVFIENILQQLFHQKSEVLFTLNNHRTHKLLITILLIKLFYWHLTILNFIYSFIQRKKFVSNLFKVTFICLKLIKKKCSGVFFLMQALHILPKRFLKTEFGRIKRTKIIIFPIGLLLYIDIYTIILHFSNGKANIFN